MSSGEEGSRGKRCIGEDSLTTGKWLELGGSGLEKENQQKHYVQGKGQLTISFQGEKKVRIKVLSKEDKKGKGQKHRDKKRIEN